MPNSTPPVAVAIRTAQVSPGIGVPPSWTMVEVIFAAAVTSVPAGETETVALKSAAFVRVMVSPAASAVNPAAAGSV
jgi:hypothetical protein